MYLFGAKLMCWQSNYVNFTRFAVNFILGFAWGNPQKKEEKEKKLGKQNTQILRKSSEYPDVCPAASSPAWTAGSSPGFPRRDTSYPGSNWNATLWLKYAWKIIYLEKVSLGFSDNMMYPWEIVCLKINHNSLTWIQGTLGYPKPFTIICSI